MAAWQQIPGIRLCSSKASEKTAAAANQSEETAITEAKPADVEASAGPSLADMSREVSYRQDKFSKGEELEICMAI